MNTVQKYSGVGDRANGPLPMAQNRAQSTPQPDEWRAPQSPPSDPVDPAEIWKPFPGYPTRYEISSLGRVCTFPGGLVMYPSLHPDGYQCIWLVKPGRHNPTACSIHWAVAMAFLPNPLGLPFVKHIDGHPLPNSASNLAWTAMPLTLSSLPTALPNLPSHD